MSESEFQSDFMQACRNAGLWILRVESERQAGIPDLTMIIKGISVWVELKASTQIKGEDVVLTHTFTPEQIAFMATIQEACGVALGVVGYKDPSKKVWRSCIIGDELWGKDPIKRINISRFTSMGDTIKNIKAIQENRFAVREIIMQECIEKDSGQYPRKHVVGYRSGNPFSLMVEDIGDGHYLSPPAAVAFRAMKEAAARDGITLKVNSSFRDNDDQKILYAKWRSGTGNLASKPGYSNHQSGIAVDIETGGRSSAIYGWLAKNAKSFGFTNTVSREPWHWEHGVTPDP